MEYMPNTMDELRQSVFKGIHDDACVVERQKVACAARYPHDNACNFYYMHYFIALTDHMRYNKRAACDRITRFLRRKYGK